MKEVFKKIAEKELDNLIYVLIVVVMILVVVGAGDGLPKVANSMISGLFGALMVKVKGA